MIYKVRHSTQLQYASPVIHAQFNLRLVPTPWPGQSLKTHHLQITPKPDVREDLVGPYCVNSTHISFHAPLKTLKLHSEFTIEVMPPRSIDGPLGNGPDIAALRSQALSQRDISPVATAPYLFASRIARVEPEIGEWAAQNLGSDLSIVPAARALMGAIHREFAYQPGTTSSDTPPIEAFHQRRGVCQDFAHVMIIALRSQGIPAAYASGYLRTLPPPGMPRLVGADAMHAWVNVWCGTQLGWIAFDPTNNCLAHQDHIQIGMGRDYADVSPIDGIFIGSAPQTMTTSVDVQA